MKYAINFISNTFPMGKNISYGINIFITYARKMDQSDRSVGLDYISIFHPNNPPLVLGMLVECVATDASSSNSSRYGY